MIRRLGAFVAAGLLLGGCTAASGAARREMPSTHTALAPAQPLPTGTAGLVGARANGAEATAASATGASATGASETGVSETGTSATGGQTTGASAASAAGGRSGTSQAPGGEVLGDAKQAASDLVVRLTTYEAGAAWPDVVAAAAPGGANRAALAAATVPLHHPGQSSRGSVVYAQLGGFRAERASVMVVVHQQIGSDAGGAEARTETRTIDVRLARTAGRWSLETVASVGGDPVARPAGLSPVARAVVDNPRIELPDSARWDIYRGLISPRLLGLLADVAAQTPIGVTVLESGHPHDVFGTGRTSNHTRGLAADLWRIGDTRVVDGRAAGSAVHDLVVRLHQRRDVSELGSPWRLGPGSFTDTVHQDHLHIAVRP